jgi:capsular polysaccharide transport system permease protein
MIAGGLASRISGSLSQVLRSLGLTDAELPNLGANPPKPSSARPGDIVSRLDELKQKALSRERWRWLVPGPKRLAALVLIAGVAYFGVIGRSRYQVTSDFIVRLPQAPNNVTPSLLGTVLAGPTMLGSLEDGRFLAVYLTSPEVMQRVFLRLEPETTYAKKGLDPFAGMPRDARFDQKLAFFRRQVSVVPQDLTGVIQLTTTGLNPSTAFKLNRLLLNEAENFLNTSNQNISRNQQTFAEQELENARARLARAQQALAAFNDRQGEINPEASAEATGRYIAGMEAKLVDLQVEEGRLRRQFLDPNSPEVAYVTDQIIELKQQIEEERAKLVGPEDKNLNQRLVQSRNLQTEVEFAEASVKAAQLAADNSRLESQRQLKFLVLLSNPETPSGQSLDWRWKGLLSLVGLLLVGWGLASFVLGISRRQ